MNLEKLFTCIIGVVIAFSAAGQLDVLQAWVWRAQAKVNYESRTSTWGSPRFFKEKSGEPVKHKKIFTSFGAGLVFVVCPQFYRAAKRNQHSLKPEH